MKGLRIEGIAVESGGKEIVKNASLSVLPAHITALVGPNGSGKSTLLSALLGHPAYKITGGSCFLDGEDISSFPTHKKARAGLFLSLQHIPAISGVKLSHFLYKAHKAAGGESSPQEFGETLKHLAQEYAMDESFFNRDMGGEFSGGERKMSEALQMLILKPKYALLDEIDSGVDAVSLSKILRIISFLRGQGTGFLLVTHYENFLKRLSPDHIYEISHGIITQR
ncbi:ATP-binding cassette domain-containing protein [bacterium]|nr:ATP-binding cassette domain-containing protein [bacterium]MCI0566193.1 ATP-binding cassette domain-containing protein [bacterium]MCI0680044.1 ATP-binding cassette domain-containing protein [bacterium]